MPKTQTDYSNTIIYAICCKDPQIKETYVGHTTNLIQRKNQHKTSCNNINDKSYNRYVYQFIRLNGGFDNWKFLQLDQLICKDKREAECREDYWIKQLNAKLNSNNPYTLYSENPSEYKKQWYEENKQEILEKAKDNYQENKEHKLEYQKQYAEQHKDKIKEQQKIYREKNAAILSEQKKNYRENHKEEISKLMKDWREKNKDKLKQKRSQIINCECGNNYTFGNKNRHFTSDVHMTYQNSLCGIINEEPTQEELELKEKEKQEKLKIQQKLYREKNAEKIKLCKKQNYETNKEKILEQNKKYYETNKEKILEQNKTYVNNNKELIAEKAHNRYEKNKEKIFSQIKTIITCECGSQFQKRHLSCHKKSTKHIDYINSMNEEKEELDPI